MSKPPTLPPHVDRMLVERYELSARLIALSNFVANADGPFNTLPREEQADMMAQMGLMGCYKDVLERRIHRADPENTHP